jgi:hypothetical protein
VLIVVCISLWATSGRQRRDLQVAAAKNFSGQKIRDEVTKEKAVLKGKLHAKRREGELLKEFDLKE